MFNLKLAAVALSGLLALGGFGLVAADTGPATGEVPSRTLFARLRGIRGPQIPLVNPDERDRVIAETLGISVEDLREARDDGIRLPALAANLDVDMAEVVDALQALLIDEVQQAVIDGNMTQERADRILERIEVADVVRDYFGWEARLDVLANSLDMSADEFLAAREDGISLRELLEGAGVEPEEVREAMTAAREEAINQALEDGALTEDQAERLLHAPGHFLPRGLRGRFFRFNPPAGPTGAGQLPGSLLNG